jgi:hypothetical protein
MYTRINFRTKKALKEAVASGQEVDTFQPGGIFPAQTDGQVCIEGPHYPEPHKWYASVLIENGIIKKVVR